MPECYGQDYTRLPPTVASPFSMTLHPRVPHSNARHPHFTSPTLKPQIPDVDAVVHAGDVPCMRKKWMHGGPPQVLLGVQGSVRHFDVPLPDYTLWVDELQLIQVLRCRSGEQGKGAGVGSWCGWDA